MHETLIRHAPGGVGRHGPCWPSNLPVVGTGIATGWSCVSTPQHCRAPQPSCNKADSTIVNTIFGHAPWPARNVQLIPFRGPTPECQRWRTRLGPMDDCRRTSDEVGPRTKKRSGARDTARSTAYYDRGGARHEFRPFDPSGYPSLGPLGRGGRPESPEAAVVRAPGQ